MTTARIRFNTVALKKLLFMGLSVEIVDARIDNDDVILVLEGQHLPKNSTEVKAIYREEPSGARSVHLEGMSP